MNLTYITKSLNTQEKCVKYLEKQRWGGQPICPYCSSRKNSPKRLRHTCHGCKRSFSVRVGTVLHNSNLPLQKWLMAISIMLSAKKGVSALQLARDLSVNKNTAWLLQMKIRAAMKEDDFEFFRKEFRSVKVTLTRIYSRSGKSSQSNSDSSLLKDGFSHWGHLKRALFGQYHRIDEHYLHRYIDEIVFKCERNSAADQGYSDLLIRALRI